MQYLLLVYLEPSAQPTDDAAIREMFDEYRVFTRSLQESGMFLGGEALQDVANATSVTVRDGRRLVTDGPFAETKEHLAGFYLIEAPDLDAAIDAAARVPDAKIGTVEVRPILDMA
ncbi:MAG TPA: YciI family protein [Candidatus Limnocylindrales bacterium]